MGAVGCVAAGLGDDVRICHDGGLKIDIVGRAGAGADGGGGVERFGAAEYVAVGAVDVACAFSVAEIGASFEN